jgi:hypothetical protein
MRNAKLKQEQQLLFFQSVANMSRNQTFDYCKDLIESARVPNYTLINQMKSMNKDCLMIAMNNFIMKGQGYGV